MVCDIAPRSPPAQGETAPRASGARPTLCLSFKFWRPARVRCRLSHGVNEGGRGPDAGHAVPSKETDADRMPFLPFQQAGKQSLRAG
eukprot:gene14308-biopygen23111